MKTILACIAVFVVIAGSATAAGTALITGAQIKNGTIGLVDISPKAKAALKGQRGPRGPQGFPGADGAPGQIGPVGPAGGFNPAKIIYMTGTTFEVAVGGITSGTTYCPVGTKAISGGWTVITGGVGEVWGNRSYDSGGSWTVSVANHSDFTVATVTPFAICAAP